MYREEEDYLVVWSDGVPQRAGLVPDGWGVAVLGEVGPVGGQVLGGEQLRLGEGGPVRGVDQEDLLVPVAGRVLQTLGTQPGVVGRLKK